MFTPAFMTLLGGNGQGNLDVVKETDPPPPEALVGDDHMGYPHDYVHEVEELFFTIARDMKPRKMVRYKPYQLTGMRTLHSSMLPRCYYAQKFLHLLCFADAKNPQLITPRMVVDLAEQMIGMLMFYGLSKSEEDIIFVDRPCVDYADPKEAAWEKELMELRPTQDGALVEEYSIKVVYVARGLIQSVQDGVYSGVLNFTVTWVESHTRRNRVCSYNGRWKKVRLHHYTVDFRETDYVTEVEHEFQDSYLRKTVFELKPPRCACCLATRKKILETWRPTC